LSREPRENRNEEIRGIFVLGLLAVLIAIKLQSPSGKLDVTLGQLKNLDIMPLINFIIILWSLYAFFMVFGLSEDVVGKTISQMFRGIARACLLMNFVLLAFLGAFYGYFAYPTRLPYVIGLILIILIFGALKEFLKARKKPKKQSRWKLTIKGLKENLSVLMLFGLFVIIAVILQYPDDWIRLPAFIIGCVVSLCIIFWYKDKKPESSKIDEYYR
jgi:hypothetical protein